MVINGGLMVINGGLIGIYWDLIGFKSDFIYHCHFSYLNGSKREKNRCIIHLRIRL